MSCTSLTSIKSDELNGGVSRALGTGCETARLSQSGQLYVEARFHNSQHKAELAKHHEGAASGLKGGQVVLVKDRPLAQLGAN